MNDGTAALVFATIPAAARHDPLVDMPWELATIELLGDDPYSISGSRLSLRDGITVRQTVRFGTQHGFANEVQLRADNVWSVESSGGTLASTGNVDLGAHRLTLLPEGGTFISLAGGISGTGGLVKDGAGTLVLSGNSSYSGGTTLLFGKLEVRGPSAVPPGTFVLKNGILDLGSSGAVLGPGDTMLAGLVLGGVIGGAPNVSAFPTPLVISTLGDWIVYDATDGTSESLIGGTIDLASASGSRILRIHDSVSTTEELTVLAGIVNPASQPGPAPAIRKLGQGRMILSGINTYARALQVEEGAVQLTRAEAVGATGAANPTVVLVGATLEITQSFTVSTETLRLNGSGLAGTGALHSLSGSHIWGGGLFLDSDAAIGVEPAGSGLTITGTVCGNAALAKVGAGTLILTATNDYQGATLVQEGTLRADNGSGDAIPGAVTVRSGGTLAGNGSASGAILVQAGGRIDPSASGATVSRLAAEAVTFSPGSTLHVALLANGINAGVDVRGSAQFAGRLELAPVAPYVPAAGHRFTLVGYASRSGEFTDLALPPLAAGLQWSLAYGPHSLVARVSSPTDVPVSEAVRTALTGAGPNPCVGGARIHFELARRGRVRLEILDVTGRIVSRLADSKMGPGAFAVDWNGRTAAGSRAPSGVYLLRLRLDGRIVPPGQRLVLVR